MLAPVGVASRSPSQRRERSNETASQAARVKSIEFRKKLDAMTEETAPATSLAGFRALVKAGKALLEEVGAAYGTLQSCKS
jgi:hypothetical protein